MAVRSNAAQPKPTAAEARKQLRALADPAVARTALRYVKSGKGDYGEGDVYLGVNAPTLRTLSRGFRALPLPESLKLLQSAVHEERSLALIVLVWQYERADERGKTAIFKAYIKHKKWVNNWDLVDLSAPAIVGGHLLEGEIDLLHKLAKSKVWSDRRIAMVATQHFIRHNRFDATVALAEQLLNDPHDLLHKAAGWMLREVGDRDLNTLRTFLKQHAAVMPRTMLRYAIEKLRPDERKQWMEARNRIG